MSLAPSNGVFNDSPPTVPTISLSHFTHQPRRLVTRSGRLSTTTFLFFPHTLVHRLYYQPHTTLIHYSAREREGEGRESQPLPRYPVDGFYPFNPGVGWRKILFWHLFMVFFTAGKERRRWALLQTPVTPTTSLFPLFFSWDYLSWWRNFENYQHDDDDTPRALWPVTTQTRHGFSRNYTYNLVSKLVFFPPFFLFSLSPPVHT